MLRTRLPYVLALPALASATAAQQFVYTPSAISSGNIWTDGIELVDVDRDSDIDILFANGSSYGSGGFQPQHLFLNDGSGSFSAAHGQLNVNNFNAKMVIAEDFDNDGDPDLMYAPEGPFPNTTQVPRMLINNGFGVFSDQSATRLPSITMASFCVCAGDVDDDGDLDVVFTDGATFFGVATQARLYENNGNGFFTNVTGAQMPSDTYNAQDVTLFDYDGDFDIDIALSGKGQNGKRGRLYLNDSTGNFSVSNAMNGLGTGQTYEIEWGDLDGDADLDAMVQSISGQNEGWGRNDGPMTTLPETTFSGGNGGDDNEMVGLDYDNDGDIDVVVGSLSSTEKVYRNTNANFQRVNGVIQAQGDSTLDLGVADLDGDGAYDIVTGQGESGNFTNKIYFNNGPADTIAPSFIRVETPSGVSTPETVFHVQVQDAIRDDGHVNVTMQASYTTVDDGAGTSGNAPVRHQGGGQFRVAIPTIATTTQVNVTWTATDSVGNSAMFGPVIAGGPPCAPPVNYGTGEVNSLGSLAVIGSAGGDPTVGNPNFQITLTGGMPNNARLLLESAAGMDSAPTVWGTLLVAQPFVRYPGLTDGSGGATHDVAIVPGMVGMTMYYTWIVRDAGFGGGAQHSDGLAVTFCP